MSMQNFEGYLDNNNLSLGAMGLFTYLWRHSTAGVGHFSISKLVKTSSDGSYKVIKYVHELETKGYLTRENKVQDSEGRFTSSEWILTPDPN